eukprot:gnl/MRDRNA2_/MRDRNA2_85552_c0_seq4.p1 gnl/MRDRNA2_/MRDRNA2_85552_c0~~gnl/MRDRNA2_/MRDRNA2_85552_c0_seq4.p1  ORF type:complete len:317 (+),score=-13.70 gnl/MRDRNA2_/MRDRNA2_85552_c0_seq4:2-952(+)
MVTYLKGTTINYLLRIKGHALCMFAEDRVTTYKRLKKTMIKQNKPQRSVFRETKKSLVINTSPNISIEAKKNHNHNGCNKRCGNKKIQSVSIFSDIVNEISSASKSQSCATTIEDYLKNNSLPREYQMLKWIQKWCYDWKKDLELRPEYAALSARGRRAYTDYNVTVKAFDHFFEQLKKRTLTKELKDRLWPVILAMRDRNYSDAYTILLNSIAIGNSPWPIGVTQVGIHTKSAAREKISTIYSNKNAAAHIMSDEATRKCLHGLKRLLTVMQRLYPSDPSRCIEFFDEIDFAKGSYGAGSLKLALLKIRDNTAAK